MVVTPLTRAAEIAQRLCANIGSALVLPQGVIEWCLVALLARGHLLIEDVPGLGKTTLAKALAVSCGCRFKRIQFVPDLLPSDITGVNIFNQQTASFEFHPGPLMAQVVLADEINRAPAKTQAALLEAMEEYQTTVDGVTHTLPQPFFVIATQNPIEHHGTFALPETQLDRFLMRVTLGYATAEQELAILERQERTHPLETLKPVTSPEEMLFLQQTTKDIYVDPLIRQYIVAITQATRRHHDLVLGASHRASLALFRAVQALAVIREREFVSPDDVKEMAPGVLVHRLIPAPEARARGLNSARILDQVLEETSVPGTPH